MLIFLGFFRTSVSDAWPSVQSYIRLCTNSLSGQSYKQREIDKSCLQSHAKLGFIITKGNKRLSHSVNLLLHLLKATNEVLDDVIVVEKSREKRVA